MPENMAEANTRDQKRDRADALRQRTHKGSPVLQGYIDVIYVSYVYYK